MYNSSSSEFNYDEDVYDIEEDRILGEKVTCKDLTFMVVDELFPGLTLLAFGGSDHVSSNSASRVLYAKLDYQFLKYLVFSPVWIFSRYPLYEFYMFSWDRRSTDLFGTRTPTPVESISLSVPTDDRIRFHKNQRRFPIVPYFGQKDPEKSVLWLQSWSTFLFPKVDT